jgi:hypothetical protein
VTKALKYQFIFSISGIPGNWEQSSGGDISAPSTKVRDGGSDRPTVLGGLPETDDIEVTRTFDPHTEVALLAALRKNLGRSRHTLTKQATDANRVKVGKPVTYPGSLLVGLTEPEHEEGSSDPSTIKLKFSTPGAA